MSNAYVFEDAPAEGGDAPVGPAGDGDESSPLPFILLLVAALILAVVIVLLLVRCCGGADSPEIALRASSGIVGAFGAHR